MEKGPGNPDTKGEELMAELAQKAIERLKTLPPPVVRVFGPLTSGGRGYDENLRRFNEATRILREKGYTVFDYFDTDDEERIKEANLPWETVMEYYHRPILETGLISKGFFLPDWESSNGATWEYALMTALPNMETEAFPEEWFNKTTD
ncbi:MAG: DUF4406 domain-containing protein [Candidatus Paceibacterota bacterium]